MRAEEIKGLIEAYSKVHETPEVLNEAPVTGNQFLDRILQGGQAFLQGRPRPTGVVNPAIQLAQQYRNAGGTGAPPTGWKPGSPVNSSRPPAAPPPKQKPPGSTPPRQEPPRQEPPSGSGNSTSAAKPVSTTVLAKKGGVEGKLDKATGKFTAGAFSAAEKSRYASVAAKNSATSTTKSTSPQTGDKAKDMATWEKSNPTLAKNVTPSGTQKGSGQSEMSRQAAELRDMQKASQMRQKGADVMGSNITSVRQDLEKANKPENLNKPAPAGTALERQQKMTALKKPSADLKFEHLDIFDIVKGHLLDEGYAETEENALVIMANMSEEWRDSIIEAQRARENPEDHDKEEKRKYEPVRGEKTPMPPRGDKRREDFEKWYAKHVR
jgi:hypothetical protein